MCLKKVLLQRLAVLPITGPLAGAKTDVSHHSVVSLPHLMRQWMAPPWGGPEDSFAITITRVTAFHVSSNDISMACCLSPSPFSVEVEPETWLSLSQFIRTCTQAHHGARRRRRIIILHPYSRPHVGLLDGMFNINLILIAAVRVLQDSPTGHRHHGDQHYGQLSLQRKA